MELSGASVLVAAAVLGVTHGLEPDHAAGISALTTEADGPTHAAFVGGCFAVGHVLVVLAWVGLLAVVGRAVASAGALDAAGSIAVGLVLLGVATLLAATGSRRLRGLPAHPSPAEASSAVGRTVSFAHAHLHHSHERRADYLRTGVVGSLFALSPPVSMLALISTVVPTGGVGAALGAVSVYAVTITAAMAAIGGGVGELFSLLSGRRRLHAAFELGTSALVLAFAVRLLL